MTEQTAGCFLVEVALPVPLDQTFTYRHPLPGSPAERVIVSGDLVKVPFGRRRLLGLVVGVKKSADDVREIQGHPLKNILALLRPEYRIAGDRRRLADWLAEYYVLPLGMVLPLFHPPKPETKGRKSRIKTAEYPEVDKADIHLTASQEKIVALGRQALDAGTFKPILLHGVTGSGKTEVYLNIIQAAVQRGKDALFLLPEIALTPQTLARIRSRFGDEVAAVHSGLSAGERCRVHEAAARGEIKVVVGPRSALFAPLRNVGVIVVDEEHETSYKQDETPRYHARHAALVRGREMDAVVVLGSATPDLESMDNALQERYVMAALPERVGGTLPEVEVVDVRGTSQPEGFSRVLSEAMEKTLEAGEQIILYYNRRGFARVWQCCSCGEIVECPHCDIGLTYHLRPRRLLCHYCDHTQDVPEICGECGQSDFLPAGGGTEKVELNLQARFPEARILRLDHDTTRRRGSHQDILASFARREADILVGTQMVAKGHHFPGVSLVGVLAADHGLAMPDFRASERSFQLLTQVAGRAGRTGAGRVIFQTYQPEHPVIQAAAAHDYEAFLASELPMRKALDYPPFQRLTRLGISGKKQGHVEAAAMELAEALRRELGPREMSVMGPAPGVFPRLGSRYRFQIMIKGPFNAEKREWLAGCLSSFREAYKGIDVMHDMDPLSVY